MTTESDAVLAVAGFMALAARTAPKGKGVDTLDIRVLGRRDAKKLAARLKKLGEERQIGFFQRDAQNIDGSDACVVIGCRGRISAGVNCGGCGYPTCAAFDKAAAAVSKKKPGKAAAFRGPNCVIRMADAGIAVGSAAKTAQIHNADNRIMYSGGVAALDLGLVSRDCTVAYVIPLSATGKNIFFDRKS